MYRVESLFRRLGTIFVVSLYALVWQDDGLLWVSGFSVSSKKTTSSSTSTTSDRPRIVIVGGGWAGYTAAEEISSSCKDGSVEVVLLDASKKGVGGLAGGYRTSQGRPLDVGIHGFWREYRNTFDILNNIDGIPDLDDILTDYIPSVLYSQASGQVAVAPVMSTTGTTSASTTTKDCPTAAFAKTSTSTSTCPSATATATATVASLSQLAGEVLPPPLDLALSAKYNEGGVLSWQDRVSALGLAGYWADFRQEDAESWKMYDDMSAQELLNRAGLTKNLRSEMVDPLLHVLPMCPDYDCSAAAMLSCFHVFALQSKGAFDVRWCRGSIAELIFQPWQTQLLQRPHVQILQGQKVTSITNNNNNNNNNDDTSTSKPYCIHLDSQNENEKEGVLTCDAIIVAVGATSIRYIAQSSPPLQQYLPAFQKLRGVTCVAVRLFLKPYEGESTYLRPDIAKAMEESPIAVCGPGILQPQLNETGFCIYDLNRMHDEFQPNNQNNKMKEPVGVLEVDFYRADSIVDESDEDIAKLTLQAVQRALKLSTPILPDEHIVDVAVIRARNAVSHFAPGSATLLLPEETNNNNKEAAGGGVTLVEKGIYLAGDWVDRTGHASWSTEKSVVTARQAASKVCQDLNLSTTRNIDIIPAATDTPYLKALRRSVQLARKTLLPQQNNDILPPTPWVQVQQTLSKLFPN